MAREALQDLIRACAWGMPSSIRVFFVPRILRNDADKLGQLLNRSFQKLSVIYAFLEAVKNDRGLAMSVSIVDVDRQPDGTPVLERYVLDTRESLAVADLAVNTVCLIEMVDVTLAKEQPVETSPYATTLLNQPAFVHIDRNCIEFLESRLEAGHSVEWAAASLGYTQGPVQHRTGIHLCLYWLGASGPPHFHLATSEGIEAIQSYTDTYIADSRRLRQISAEPAFDSLLLSKLIDHPIFNYYFASTSPKLHAGAA